MQLEPLTPSPVLLQRGAGRGAGYTEDVMTNHAGLIRAVHVLTARTKTNRSRRHEIGDQRRADNRARDQIERIAALHERRYAETGEKFVDETGSSDETKGRGNTCRSRTTQVSQIRAITVCRKKSRVADLRGVDGTNRTGRRGLIRRHLGFEQVRDSDSRDDQNDRHDDQQFDKRETLLFLHAFSLRNFMVPEHAVLACKPETNLEN